MTVIRFIFTVRSIGSCFSGSSVSLSFESHPFDVVKKTQMELLTFLSFKCPRCTSLLPRIRAGRLRPDLFFFFSRYLGSMSSLCLAPQPFQKKLSAMCSLPRCGKDPAQLLTLRQRSAGVSAFFFLLARVFERRWGLLLLHGRRGLGPTSNFFISAGRQQQQSIESGGERAACLAVFGLPRPTSHARFLSSALQGARAMLRCCCCTTSVVTSVRVKH